MVFLRVSAGWRGRKAAYMAIVVVGCSALTWAAHVGLRSLFVPMRLSVTGVNHKTAPVEVRERLAFDERALAEALARAEVAPRRRRGADPLHLQPRGSRRRRPSDEADPRALVSGFLAGAAVVEPDRSARTCTTTRTARRSATSSAWRRAWIRWWSASRRSWAR